MQLSRELRPTMTGPDVAALHQELAKLGFRIPGEESQQRRFGRGTQEAVRTFQGDHGLDVTGVVNQPTADAINAAVVAAAAKKLAISGQLRQQDATPVVGALVRAFEVGSAGDGNILGEAKTGLGGSYRLQCELKAGSEGTDIQVRAFEEDGTTLLAESEVLRGVRTDITVNLTVGTFAKRDYVVKGHVRWEDEGWVVGHSVRAFELMQSGERQLGEDTTDSQGQYEISYQYSGLKGRDLVVRVYDEQGAELVSSGRIENAHQTEVVHLTASREPEPGDDFVVRGEVRGADGALLAGTTVRAFDVDLRHEEQLGEQATGEAGRYEIRYRREQFSRAEKESADLRVRVLGSGGEVLVASPVIFNAQPIEEVNLMIGGGQFEGPSEYELLVADLTPLVGDVPFAELTEEDVTFLAGETGEDAGRIGFLARAHLFSGETEVPAEAFYGMFRQKLPTELAALLAESSDAQRQALVTAVEENIIPVSFRDRIEEILERLEDLAPGQVLDPPAPDGGASVDDLLRTTLGDEGLREQFASAYAAHTGPIQEFWDGLSERPEFADKVEDLQFTVQLGGVTGNRLELVEKLQSLKEAGEISTVRDLARFDAEEWRQIVSEEGVGVPPGVPGQDDDEKVQNYASAMAGVVEDAFPTSFVARRLESEVGSGVARSLAPVSSGEHLRTFFSDNEDSFDFAGTRLQSYLVENPDALAGIPEENRPRVQQQVETMQRLYRVAPRYEQMRVLMDDGLHSAQGITLMGQSAFAIKYSAALSGEAQANQVFENAQQVTSTAMLLLADAGMPSKRLAMTAVPDTTADEVEGIPDWRALFRSLDLCACEHCRSVYSPAAYLVDVLHFLGGRRLVDTNSPNGDDGPVIGISFETNLLDDGTEADATARDVLFDRRPDLGKIELTCENTNVPLPYVDLANEAMEEFIAPSKVHSGVGDFSATENPTGAWSYGYRASPDSDFTPYDDRGNPWGESFDQWSLNDLEPHVTYNNTGSTASHATIVHPPDVLNVHPGPAGERSVVRWIAPTPGTVAIEGRFEGIDTAGTSTDVAVVHNS
ncbi:MAG TPA: peptidoglycan-binding domain-containing protein, partial [Rubrobacter sp.]|nr:peptidoglycan-binding domain-containing protein [Rubrobacter sp.]